MDNEARVTGWWVFAGILLAIAGVLNVIWGIAAVSNSKFFTESSVYVVSSLHTWGWVTMIIGVIQIIAAFSLFSGGGFGRVIGIVAGSIGAIEALAGTGTTPFWSISVFALCVAVVYRPASRRAPSRRSRSCASPANRKEAACPTGQCFSMPRSMTRSRMRRPTMRPCSTFTRPVRSARSTRR